MPIHHSSESCDFLSHRNARCKILRTRRYSRGTDSRTAGERRTSQAQGEIALQQLKKIDQSAPGWTGEGSAPCPPESQKTYAVGAFWMVRNTNHVLKRRHADGPALVNHRLAQSNLGQLDLSFLLIAVTRRINDHTLTTCFLQIAWYVF